MQEHSALNNASEDNKKLAYAAPAINPLLPEIQTGNPTQQNEACGGNGVRAS